MNKGLKYWFSWIAVLPGALIAGLLSIFLLHLILVQTLKNFVEPYPEFPERALTPFSFTMTFVWIGSQIAPNNKFKVAILLFAISMFLSGGLIIATLTGGTLFGKSLFFQANGVASLMGIIGAFVGLYLSRDRTKNEVSVSLETKNLLTKKTSEVTVNSEERKSFYKKFETELISLTFITVLTFCIYNERFRFWSFVILFIVMSLGFIVDLSFKEKFYTTTKAKINLAKNIISTIALVIGFLYASAGYYISIAFLILYIFEIIRHIIMTYLIGK